MYYEVIGSCMLRQVMSKVDLSEYTIKLPFKAVAWWVLGVQTEKIYHIIFLETESVLDLRDLFIQYIFLKNLPYNILYTY